MILETTTRTDLDQRVAQHSAMVEAALNELGMMGAACADRPNSTDISEGQLSRNDAETAN